MNGNESGRRGCYASSDVGMEDTKNDRELQLRPIEVRQQRLEDRRDQGNPREGFG